MDLKDKVLQIAHLAEKKGLVNAMEGNLSVYDREGDCLYITPSGKSKYLLAKEDIAVLDYERNQISGNYRASSEYRLHEAAYKARPDIGGVIHCHAPYLTAYALCGKKVRMDYYSEFVMAYKEIEVIPFGMPGTHEIHTHLEGALLKNNVVLLGNHGVVAVGSDLEQALRFLEGAEGAARIMSITGRIGIPKEIPKEAFEACWNFGRSTKS